MARRAALSGQPVRGVAGLRFPGKDEWQGGLLAAKGSPEIAMTTTDPAGRVAFITGGASGIGLAVATLLQRSGMKLALMDLTEPALQAAASQLSDGEVHTITGDVTRPDDCARAVAAAVQRFGGVDLCWANAGIGTLAPLRHVDASEWIQVVQVNVFGVLHTVQTALPQLIARRGQIAVSASVASLAHAPCMSAYAASKAAAEAMCDSWRIELAHHGVDVTCIHPLWVITPMVERGRDSRAFARLRQSAAGPLGRETPLAVAAPLMLRASWNADGACSCLAGRAGCSRCARRCIRGLWNVTNSPQRRSWKPCT